MKTYRLLHYRTSEDVGLIQSEEVLQIGDRFKFYCFRNRVVLDLKIVNRRQIPDTELYALTVAIMNEKHNDLIQDEINKKAVKTDLPIKYEALVCIIGVLLAFLLFLGILYLKSLLTK